MKLRGDQLRRVGAWVELWRDDGSPWKEGDMSFYEADDITLLPGRNK